MPAHLSTDVLVNIAGDWLRDRNNAMKLRTATALVANAPTDMDFLRIMDAHAARFSAALPPMSPELWEAFCEIAYVTKNGLSLR